MKTLTRYSLIIMVALLLPAISHANDDLEVTLEAVPANGSPDVAISNIELPAEARHEAREYAQVGLDTANEARRLREQREQMDRDFGRNFGEGVSDEARERAHERTGERAGDMQVPGGRR